MKILLSGSVAFDYLMTFPGYFKDHILPEHLDSISLSFLVDSMIRHPGGIAPNIAYTMALLGERPHLWATVGEDFEEYRSWLELKGVDTSGAKVIPTEYTASFFVNTDRSNAQIASFYPGAMGYAAQHPIAEMKNLDVDLVVISPNDPEAMKLYVRECIQLKLPYIYDPSQQICRLSPEDLKSGIENSIALFVNDYEFALIRKMTHWRSDDMLKNNPSMFIVVTRGEDGAEIFLQKNDFIIPIIPAKEVVDPTGVGDAFRGGFLTGYSHSLDLKTCGRMGVLAATYCIEQRGPQGHSYTKHEFIQRYRENFDDYQFLDILVSQE